MGQATCLMEAYFHTKVTADDEPGGYFRWYSLHGGEMSAYHGITSRPIL